MKRLLAVTILVLAPFIFGFTLYWDPVTTYTDNTLIGAEAGGIFYNIEMDNTIVVVKTSATSWVIPTVPKKSSHTFRAQAEAGTGEKSVWSPPFPWTAPAGNPTPPGRLRDAP